MNQNNDIKTKIHYEFVNSKTECKKSKDSKNKSKISIKSSNFNKYNNLKLQEEINRNIHSSPNLPNLNLNGLKDI